MQSLHLTRYEQCARHIGIGEKSGISHIHTVGVPSGAIGGGQHLCAVHAEFTAIGTPTSGGFELKVLSRPLCFCGLCPRHFVGFFAVHTYFHGVAALGHPIKSINIEGARLCQIHFRLGTDDSVGFIHQAHQPRQPICIKGLQFHPIQIGSFGKRVEIIDAIALLVDAKRISRCRNVLHIGAIFLSVFGACLHRALQFVQLESGDHTVCGHFWHSGVVVETASQDCCAQC